MLEVRLGDLTKAKALYSEVVGHDPAHAKASEALIRLAEKEGDWRTLAQLLERRAMSRRGAEKAEADSRINWDAGKLRPAITPLDPQRIADERHQADVDSFIARNRARWIHVVDLDAARTGSPVSRNTRPAANWLGASSELRSARLA